MKFFLVWEQFDNQYKLVEKGNHFLSVDDVNDIDVAVGNYEESMANAKDINPFLFVVTTCQPLPE